MTFPAPRIPEEPTRPTLEGSVAVRDGRRLSFAEYGSRRGPAIVWMHGTPGARRQIPVDARAYADEVGARIIGIDRPGIGSSTPHLYDDVLDWSGVLTLLLDALAIDSARVIGRVHLAIGLGAFFLWGLVRANLRLALDVATPSFQVKAGVLARGGAEGGRE